MPRQNRRGSEKDKAPKQGTMRFAHTSTHLAGISSMGYTDASSEPFFWNVTRQAAVGVARCRSIPFFKGKYTNTLY